VSGQAVAAPLPTSTDARLPIILASASAIRRTLLENAGVRVIVDPGRVDEDEIKSALKGGGASVETTAEALAEAKAQRVSGRHWDGLVVGADQMLECNGVWFDKPADRAHAAAHLASLSGKTHRLISAVVAVRNNTRLWHHVGIAKLTMRPLSPDFIDTYLDAAGDAALASVGAYQLEGLGAQLFERVKGDFFTILGLPLLPVLAILREHQVVAA
jgi:septum formation protein